MPTHKIDLDFNKSIQLVRPEIVARVGDAETQTVEVTLFDCGIPYTPTGELRIQIKRRDGGLVYTNPMSRVSNNVYKAVLPGQTFTYRGETKLAYVAEYQGGKICQTTSDFRLKVLPGTTDAEAIQYFDQELEEIREYANNAVEIVTDAEDQRNAAEQERVAAETKREQAETKRASAESTREGNEATRKSAEQTRQSQESTRQSQERTRESNEATRKSAESGRVTAETARAEAEQARETAEDERAEAEQARETAEGKREQYITQLKADVESGELDGATFTPAVDDLGNLSWTNDKERPNPETRNIRGPQGEKGDTGEGLQVLGVYEDLAGLQRDHASGERVGDAYMVGPNYYVWDGAEWQDAGELQGAKGDKGDTGGYYTPSVSDEGELTWQRSDLSMPEVPSAQIMGPEGPQGDVGPNGTKGDTGGYYTPSVSPDGELTWAGSQEGMPPVEGANIMGPPGSSELASLEAPGLLRQLSGQEDQVLLGTGEWGAYSGGGGGSVEFASKEDIEAAKGQLVWE